MRACSSQPAVRFGWRRPAPDSVRDPAGRMFAGQDSIARSRADGRSNQVQECSSGRNISEHGNLAWARSFTCTNTAHGNHPSWRDAASLQKGARWPPQRQNRRRERHCWTDFAPTIYTCSRLAWPNAFSSSRHRYESPPEYPSNPVRPHDFALHPRGIFISSATNHGRQPECTNGHGVGLDLPRVR